MHLPLGPLGPALFEEVHVRPSAPVLDQHWWRVCGKRHSCLITS